MRACPQCGSDQFKKASLIYEEGTSVVVGVGLSAGGSVGVGGGATASTLALRCAPPQQQSNDMSYSTGLAFVVWLIPFLIANSQIDSFAAITGFWRAWFVLGLVIVGRYCFRDVTAAQKLHMLAMDEYNKTYVCGRCGSFSKPFD